MGRHERREATVTRRRFAHLTAGAMVATFVPWAPRPAAADNHALVTDIPDNAAIISGTQYVNESAKPGENCGNCILYQAGDGDRGKCPLFVKGSVAESGWCISWSKKS